MKKFIAIAIAAALSLGTVATASAADWSYLEGAYTVADVNNRSGDGYLVGGSAALGQNAFVQAQYTNGADSDFNAGVAAISVGLHGNVTENSDLYGKFTASSVVNDRANYEKYGYTAEAGIRSQVADRLELRGGVIAGNLRDRRFEDVAWMATAGAEYALTETLRVGVDVRGKDDVLEGQVGLRVYF